MKNTSITIPYHNSKYGLNSWKIVEGNKSDHKMKMGGLIW
jgi:hypothetical protein